MISIAFLCLSALIVAAADPPTCTPAQLKGSHDSFKLPGGGGIYSPGTVQTPSWELPTGAPVSAIKSVAICLHDSCQAPLSTTGLPIDFPADRVDLGGHIVATLPYNVQPGPGHVFRFTITAQGADCTVDSAPFEVVQGNHNECSLGDSFCSEGRFIVPCIEQGAGSSPNIFGFPFSDLCPEGCVQNGNVASCGNANPSNSLSSPSSSYSGGEPTPWTSEPISSGSEPTSWTSEPTSWSSDPNNSGSEPIYSGNDPSTWSNEPTSWSSDPNNSGSEPIYSGNDPSTWSNEPTSWSSDPSNSGSETPTSSSGCTLGYMKCVSKSEFQTCWQTTADRTEFGSTMSCGPGTTCTPFMDHWILCH